MYSLTVETFFDAAHTIPGHSGKCKNLHGHTYKVMVKVESENLNGGMVMDFKDLKDILNAVCGRFDHTYLNDIIENPTAEQIAKFIFDEMSSKLPQGVDLSKVSVWETPGACASYWSKK